MIDNRGNLMERYPLYAMIDGKKVYFDFQADKTNAYDKYNLDLEYLGNKLPFYVESKINGNVYQGLSEHIWKSKDVISEQGVQEN